ncbi:Batten's disease protein Cln3 [Ophiocordyceps camponoti-floridani]|uniref:Protein BTN n=1 Tax=Ophiocordyceps camponoti-floridani TaxID=2030778 RepID=A0A8H4VCQ0_9HYPO|nr:Batten's disease protein Cln3 [Ophiocordyceps camponoti-floridani]
MASPGRLPAFSPALLGFSPSSRLARLSALLRQPEARVLVAFWLLGLINNVLYVIVLSAAQDLVGSLPKGIVLLADVMPSFVVKLVGPYVMHAVPYRVRIPVFIGLASTGMLLVALTPPDRSVSVKMAGVVIASLSSGGGELSFLGLLHYYGGNGLVGWASGTGAAGLVGAGLYELLTAWLGFEVSQALLLSACLPVVMFISFFFILPQEPLRPSHGVDIRHGYDAVPSGEAVETPAVMTEALLDSHPSAVEAVYPPKSRSLGANLKRARSLLVPYMIPLFLVYVAEYTINQGVSPTLLFPPEESPFSQLRGFYPFYGFLYQLGVFISRSSTSFIRVHNLYLPSFFQIGNLMLLTLHSLFYFLPSVYLVFLVIFWEGLLGGCVYVNCFAEILEKVPAEDREFSLSATATSDSAGISVAGILSIAVETGLCDYQVSHGRKWCRMIQAPDSR